MRLFFLFSLLMSSLSAFSQESDSGQVVADTVMAEPVLPPAVLFRTTTYEDVVREARKTNKPILLDFWATWCAPCHRLDKLTFTDAALGDYINANFVPYRVNIEDFSGMDIVDKYGVKTYPTMLVINPMDESVLRVITGFYLPVYLRKELESGLVFTPKKVTKRKS